MKVQLIDQPNRLGTLLVASQLEGHGILRPELSWELAKAERS